MEQKLLEPKKEECDMKDETNDIYVYIGTYMYANYVDIEHGPTDIRVARNSNKADYRLYRNLEYDLDEIQVLIANCDEFEKTHKVILLKTCLPKDKFYEVKKEFIKMVSKHEKKKLVNKFLKNLTMLKTSFKTTGFSFDFIKNICYHINIIQFKILERNVTINNFFGKERKKLWQ